MLFAAILVLPLGVPVGGPVPAAGPAPRASAFAQEAQARWYVDIEEAQRVAREQGKHVLVDFTGSQWCAHCKELETQVLGRPEFARGTADAFVLVRLDFDAELRARRDLPHAARNDALRERLGVEDFPTLVLMTAEGRPYQSFGREAAAGGGSPARIAGAFTDKLVQAQERAAFLERAVPKVVAAVVRAREPEQADAAADDAIELLAGAGEHPLARPLVPLVQASLASPKVAPERERAAVGALSAAAVVDDALIERALRLDPMNAAGLPEAALAGAFRGLEDLERVPGLIARAEALMGSAPVFDRARAARLYGDVAYWAQTWLEDAGRAARAARFALRLEPSDRALRTMLESLAGG